MASPFCLYLSSKQVHQRTLFVSLLTPERRLLSRYSNPDLIPTPSRRSVQVFTVEDLLTVNLADLEMPPELQAQLDALLTVVIGKTMHAKSLPGVAALFRVQGKDWCGDEMAMIVCFALLFHIL